MSYTAINNANTKLFLTKFCIKYRQKSRLKGNPQIQAIIERKKQAKSDEYYLLI